MTSARQKLGLKGRAKLFAIEASINGQPICGLQTFAMSQNEAVRHAKAMLRRDGHNEAAAKFEVRVLA